MSNWSAKKIVTLARQRAPPLHPTSLILNESDRRIQEKLNQSSWKLAYQFIVGSHLPDHKIDMASVRSDTSTTGRHGAMVERMTPILRTRYILTQM